MGTRSPTSAQVLGSFVSCAGTERSAPARDRGARGAGTFAALRLLGKAEISPRSPAAFLSSAQPGEVTLGSLSQQVGSALAATGGPGMCEGRGDGPAAGLFAQHLGYIIGPLRCAWMTPWVHYLRRERW